MEKKQSFARLPYRFKTIKTQLRFAFAALIVTMVVSLIIVMTVLFQVYTAQNNTIAVKTISLIEESLSGHISSLRRLIPVITREPAVRSAFGGNADKALVAEQMSKLYIFGLQYRFVITAQGQVLDPVYGEGQEHTENMLRIAGFHTFTGSGREEMFSPPHQFPFPSHDGERISYFYRLRDSQDRYATYGYVLLIVSIDSIFEDSRPLIQNQFDDFFVFDGSGALIYSLLGEDSSSDSLAYAAETFRTGRGSDSEFHGGNLYFSAPVDTYPDWHMVGVMSYGSYIRSVALVIGIVSVFMLFGTALVIWLSAAITRGITKPVEALNSAMAEFESGSTPDSLQMDAASGEMSTLVGGFNHMLENIRQNLQVIVREQDEKKTAEVAALQYQLQSLQNQINPHFLYNTLNIISFLALSGKSDEIRDFNQSLIALLRATLSDTRDTVRIQREIFYLNSYVEIMSYRYPGQFAVHIAVDETVADLQIPKLILQPLVENAMLHGIVPAGRPGVIQVMLSDQNDSIQVTVGDDGVGMDRGELEQVLQPRKGFTGIGLRNVNDRLILCYGKESALVINSERNMGTVVAFRIPKLGLLDGLP